MIQSIKNKGILSLFILVLCLFFSENVAAQSQIELVYIKIEIKGLACPYCAFGMEKELKKIAGVDGVDIELKTGLAYISTPIEQKPTAESLQEIIIDSGFTVGEIDFSDKPYIRERK